MVSFGKVRYAEHTLLRCENSGVLVFRVRTHMSYLQIASRLSCMVVLGTYRVQSLVVQADCHVTVINQVVDREQSVVWLTKYFEKGTLAKDLTSIPPRRSRKPIFKT